MVARTLATGARVLEDGVDSMMGPEAHHAALSLLAASFAFVAPSEAVLAAL